MGLYVQAGARTQVQMPYILACVQEWDILVGVQEHGISWCVCKSRYPGECAGAGYPDGCARTGYPVVCARAGYPGVCEGAGCRPLTPISVSLPPASVYRIDGLFLNIKSLSSTGTLQGLLLCGHHHTHTKSELSAFIPYIGSSPPTQ